MAADDPHQGETVLQAGAEFGDARAAMILLHGRGATANDILSLAEVFDRPEIAYVAPQAAGNTWYPRPFMSPVEANEPWLSSALKLVAGLFGHLNGEGLPPERVVLLGFLQGACLSLEFAARNARRFGGIVGLSGGLIGQEIDAARYPGSLDGTPVLLGCSDVDGHIPLRRVDESAATLAGLGAEVDKRIYRGMGHTINEDEVAGVRALLDGLAPAAA